ncbi:MAG: NAD kinase [Salinivirgaceae bacterium]|nr:NAD kinase [Salinivirgaceae bacterium]MBO7432590.1 NAD kinase [Salinivirgaceae bacterium]MBR5167121.1 NAD kinase [Salinivirgaceae bacterium]
MNVAIYSQLLGSQHQPVLEVLFGALQRHKARIWLHPLFAPVFKLWQQSAGLTCSNIDTSASVPNNLDFIIIIGGDGSFLKAISEFEYLHVPFVGINTGRLGFLADISPDDIDTAIDALATGKFLLEQRPLLELQPHIDEIKHPFALNEITVHKCDSSSMIVIHTYIDDKYLATYWADGLIIATPTGSTAYSMSAGGPILSPAAQNIIITPIASHNLTVRPLVIPDNGTIRISIESRELNYMLSLDSTSVVLRTPTEISIRKSAHSISVIKLDGHGFFPTLRNKLMWGADKRN